MLPPPIGRIGLAGGHNKVEHEIAKRTSCNLASGDLYNYPNASSIIDATQPLTFKWDTTCPITSSNVDLYLYEPTSSAGLIHVWEGVPFSDGQYTAILLPKWWNDTTTASLQLSIITSGAAAWDTSSPAGPVFTANYAASAMFATTTEDGSLKTSTVAAAATQSADAVFQNVASTQSHKGPAKGAIVAAVLVPLIVLAGVAAVAVRFWRAREQEKRRRWSQALSTHSNLEWEKGAHSGEKPGSILGRPSTHHSVRPMSFATSSVYGIENNMAGAGAAINFPRPSVGPRSHSAENVNSPNRASVRSSVVMPDGQIRQSRISFADIARPERRSRLSLGGDLRPNTSGPPGLFRIPGATKSATELGTPNRKPVARSIADDEEEDMNISPSQLQGPQAFADSEMRRVGDKQRTGRRSIMSLGGDKSRRGSAASALSTEDFKSAASARGSVDELRDMESVMLMRRSVISQYSRGSPNPDGQFSNPPTPDPNSIEALDAPTYDPPTAPSPIAGSSTVAYGPDQMLAVYAARGKVSSSTAPIPRMLTALKPVSSTMPPPPTAGDMRSYVHLNRGTVSSTVVDALPAPGPRGTTPIPAVNLRVPVPVTRGRSNTVSRTSDGSNYSIDEDIGNAK
ncbi:MAG: hypothetical protein TREMPRED_001590 [Tremellales sp. Tagirdzhanova-0007]|nr:MAG: hypothetical protein TREMPRED_001590 [Tremellales sp. Tagirdzhanova-0007]